jgi:hypothetical protein
MFESKFLCEQFFFFFFLLLEDDDDYDSSCEQVLDGGDDRHWIHHVHDRKQGPNYPSLDLEEEPGYAPVLSLPSLRSASFFSILSPNLSKLSL